MFRCIPIFVLYLLLAGFIQPVSLSDSKLHPTTVIQWINYDITDAGVELVQVLKLFWVGVNGASYQPLRL